MERDCFTLLAEWVDVLKANDLAETTMRAYIYGVWNLAVFHEFKVHVLCMTEGHIAAYLASLGARSKSKSQYAKGIRSFYEWCWRRGYLATSPMGFLRPRRVDPEPPDRFEPEELERLLAAAYARDPRRAWALLACVGLGARRTEFVNIRRADINWERNVVLLRITKGSRPREVDISDWAAEGLRNLLAMSDGEYVLDIEPNTLNAWMHEAAVDCGFPPGRKRRVHTLRSTAVSMMLDEGIPVHVVAKFVGHRNIATTSGYANVGRLRTTAEAARVLSQRLAGTFEPATAPEPTAETARG